MRFSDGVSLLGWGGAGVLIAGAAFSAQPDFAIPGVQISVNAGAKQDLAPAVRIFLLLTVLSLAPAMLIALTAFTRIIIVLAMLRHALGMPETPPNVVLVSLALFLTLFTMGPVIDQMNRVAFEPYSQGKLTTEGAVKAAGPVLKDFMIRQTREKDIGLMLEMARVEPPQSAEEVSFVQLIPAFMLSELKTAFLIGFIIFLPFLLIDLVVSSILMAMGMLMVPPIMISLPLKILMFVLIDGWNLLARALVTSFH